MSGPFRVANLPSCVIVGGALAGTQAIPFDQLTERSRATWTAGDFGRIAAGYSPGAAAFVARLGLSPGTVLLDVACGDGNLARPAARHGANVTGLDLAPNLVEAARAAAAAESLDVRFDVGSAEALPYADASFDIVTSMFGVMFCARPALALQELVRVTRPGGRIALANWTPGGFIGSMFTAHTALVAPPAGVQSPLAWGDEAIMRRRLEPHSARLRDVQCIPRTIQLAFPVTPSGVVELFRECYGPSVRTFDALDAQGRAWLGSELRRLWRSRNNGPEGSTSVAAEYLEVRIDLA